MDQNNLMLSDQFHMLMNSVAALLGSDAVSAERANKASAAMIDFGNKLDAYQERTDNFRLAVCSMLQLPDDAPDSLVFQVLLNQVLVPRILIVNGGRRAA